MLSYGLCGQETITRRMAGATPGFVQFSILHPCFDTPHRKNLRGQVGLTYACELGGYFRELEGEILEWSFSAAGGRHALMSS